jgi:hypothetical protein
MLPEDYEEVNQASTKHVVTPDEKAILLDAGQRYFREEERSAKRMQIVEETSHQMTELFGNHWNYFHFGCGSTTIARTRIKSLIKRRSLARQSLQCNTPLKPPDQARVSVTLRLSVADSATAPPCVTAHC